MFLFEFSDSWSYPSDQVAHKNHVQQNATSVACFIHNFQSLFAVSVVIYQAVRKSELICCFVSLRYPVALAVLKDQP